MNHANPPDTKLAVPSPAQAMEQFVRPDELRRIAIDKEMEAMRTDVEHQREVEEEQKELHRLFMERHLRPEAGQRFSQMVRRAAERGAQQVEVLRFPSKWCTDRGRAINNFDPDWPMTLTGFAKEAYEGYDKRLRPLGYKIKAEIINFPAGLPGDVALFISW